MIKKHLFNGIFALLLVAILVLLFIKGKPHKRLYNKNLNDDKYELTESTVRKADTCAAGIFEQKIRAKENIKFKIDFKLIDIHYYNKIKISAIKNRKIIFEYDTLNKGIVSKKFSLKKGEILTIVNNKNSTQFKNPLKIQIYGYLLSQAFSFWAIFIFWVLLVFYFIRIKKAYLLFAPMLVLVLFYFTELHSISDIKLNSQIIYSFAALSYLCAILAFNRFFKHAFVKPITTLIIFIIGIIFFTIPIIFISYFHNFGGALTEEQLRAFMQTNTDEGLSFINAFYNNYWINGIIAGTLVLFLYSTLIIYKEKNQLKKSLLFFGLFGLSLVYLYQNYYKSNILNTIALTHKHYTENTRLFREVQEKRKKNENSHIKAIKDKQGETYIVIVGESLNKNHMGLYGYNRKTTPYLTARKDELLIFNHYFSNHTHSLQSISMALSQANQINKKEFVKSIILPNILSTAGFETEWISNQSKVGIYDYIVTAIAQSTDKSFFRPSDLKEAGNQKFNYNNEDYSPYDEVILKRLRMTLAKKTDKNRLIFVHLMGSHSEYISRYPPRFRYYDGKQSIPKLKDELQYVVNEYDNSVKYNDSIVNTIIDYCKALNSTSSVIYFSDHSEDALRNRGHNIGNFTYDMTQIPLLVWCSKKYQKEYANKYANMINHINTYCSNDFIYDFVIGLTNIKTKDYESNHDLTSSGFKLAPEELLTGHGKIKYAVKENKFYKGKLVKSD